MNNCINLPTEKRYKPRSISNFYGSNFIMSKYLELFFIRELQNIYWQHGWIRKESVLEEDPEVIASEPILNKRNLILVATKDQENFLIRHGFKSKAIGLPYCYLPEIKIQRKKDTFLIMPVHGSRDLPVIYNENYDSFINKCKELRKSFAIVDVCMHSEDIKQNNHQVWVREGFKVIKGADTHDANSLLKMKYLFMQYETVFSDSIGSHIVYAASSGAKISLFNEANYKHLIDKNEFYRDKKILKYDPKIYEFLYCSPLSAKKHKSWAQNELGFDNMPSKKELIAILKWNLKNFILDCLMRLTRKFLRIFFNKD